VGKTETAKAIAKHLFHDEKNLIKIDLSEYSEQHSVSKLIGSPPGYIGYEQGGLLTEAVRKKNYSAILFDEIEKAHFHFSDILLQILDEGKLTDTQGNVANFKNTIIFITSNLENPTGYLKPEVIGRIDSILSYKRLNVENIKVLVMKELNKLNHKIKEKKIQVVLSDKLQEKIIADGFNENYGARPLKSSFRKYVTVPIAKRIVDERITEGDYQMSIENDNISFSRYNTGFSHT
jgi:ATP-dependent Clp protease ATP-binding subunit ClpB